MCSLCSRITPDQVLGRVGAGTLSLAFGEDDITYEMSLNQRDSLAADVWARLVRGDINSASIGFIPVEGDWVEMADNSLDADPDAEDEIEVFSISRAELIEVSLVAQGAFAGATSAPAAGRLAVDAVTEAALPGGAEPTVGVGVAWGYADGGYSGR